MRWQLVLACASLLGCEAIVGADEFDTEEPYAEPTCGACVEQHCASASCDDDLACTAYASCLRSCTRDGHACRAACYYEHWRGTAPQKDFDACYRGRCAQGCVSPGGYYDVRGAACDECVNNGCREELLECAVDAACDAAASCVAASKDPNTQMSCVDNAYSDRDACLGTPRLMTQIGDCRNSCNDKCELGNDWSCVDAYEWKIAAASVERAFRLVHFSQPSEPYPDVEVAVCDSYDRLCAQPTDTGVSDEEGRVCLRFSPLGVGFQGYLETRDPASDQETLYYLRNPIAHVLNADQVILPTAAEVDFVADLLQIEGDPSRAHVAVVAFDCGDAPAVGISFALESDGESIATAAYIRDNLPTAEVNETDSSGAGFFTNVSVSDRPVRIRAVRSSTGETVAERQILLRAGAVTIVTLSPRAR
jgi:hypothetical protein